MAENDPERERQRLHALYASLTDGELEKLAAEEDSLTDEARQVLKYELALRALDHHDLVEILPQPSSDAPSHNGMSLPEQLPISETEDHDETDEEESEEHNKDSPPGLASSLVTIRRFRDLPEALLAQGGLKSAGIECYLMDENMVRLDWFYSNLVGGVKLQVRQEDAEAANEILNQPIPDEFEVDGLGAYEQPRCPKCRSLDVTFEELNKPIAYGSAFLSLPIPIHNRGWKCRTCGCEWEDSDQPVE